MLPIQSSACHRLPSRVLLRFSGEKYDPANTTHEALLVRVLSGLRPSIQSELWDIFNDPLNLAPYLSFLRRTTPEERAKIGTPDLDALYALFGPKSTRNQVPRQKYERLLCKLYQ